MCLAKQKWRYINSLKAQTICGFKEWLIFNYQRKRNGIWRTNKKSQKYFKWAHVHWKTCHSAWEFSETVARSRGCETILVERDKQLAISRMTMMLKRVWRKNGCTTLLPTERSQNVIDLFSTSCLRRAPLFQYVNVPYQDL